MQTLQTIGKALVLLAAGVNVLFAICVLGWLFDVQAPHWLVRLWKRFRRKRRRLLQYGKLGIFLIRILWRETCAFWARKADEVLGIGLVVAILLLCFIGLLIVTPQP